MAHGKSLELAKIQSKRTVTSLPSKSKRMTTDLSETMTLPDGSRYIWHNGSMRKATRPIELERLPHGMTEVGIAEHNLREKLTKI